MLHLIEEGELAGHKGGTGQKVQPPHLPCPPVDIIRAEDLKGLVEAGLLLQPLDCRLQKAAASPVETTLLKMHAVLLIEPPEQRLGELLHPPHSTELHP